MRRPRIAPDRTRFILRGRLRHLHWATSKVVFGELVRRVTPAAAVLIFLGGASPPLAAHVARRTQVVILGVQHSAQLAEHLYEPGMLSAFVREVRPDAICIERAPRLYARGSYYDFTYEQQYVLVPLARAQHIPIYPIDWEPAADDDQLAFGFDLDITPIIRPAQGWGAFQTFGDKVDLPVSFFHPSDATVARVKAWANSPPKNPSEDFPRRLYLYRTFLQAKRIEDVARDYPGGRILVVIGFFHKWNIEEILAEDSAVEVIQPEHFPLPSLSTADQANTLPQKAAILSFNLLGLHGKTHLVDWLWVSSILQSLPATYPKAERTLLSLRLRQLTGHLPPQEAAVAYGTLAASPAANRAFTWTGVEQMDRLDSYFDPFGDLTVRQRALLELARAEWLAGQRSDAQATLDHLAKALPATKAVQLKLYAMQYLFT